MTEPDPLTPAPDSADDDAPIGRAEDDTSDSDETVIGDATDRADADAEAGDDADGETDDAMPTERIERAGLGPEMPTEMHTLGAVGINLDDLKAPTGKTDKPGTGPVPPMRPSTDKPATGPMAPRRPATDKPATGPTPPRRAATDKPSTGPMPPRRPATDKPATGPARTTPTTDPVTPLAFANKEGYSPLPGEAPEEPLAKPHSFRPIDKSEAAGASDSQMEGAEGAEAAPKGWRKASLGVGALLGAAAVAALFLIPKPLPFHAKIEIAPAAQLAEAGVEIAGDLRAYPFYAASSAGKPGEIQLVDARGDKARAFASFSTTRADAAGPVWLLRSSVARLDEGTSPTLGFGLSLLAWTETGSDLHWRGGAGGEAALAGNRNFPGLQIDPKWRPVLAEDWRSSESEKIIVPAFDLARPAESKLILVDPSAGGAYSVFSCTQTILTQPVVYYVPESEATEAGTWVLYAADHGSDNDGKPLVLAQQVCLSKDGKELIRPGEDLDFKGGWYSRTRKGPVEMKRMRLGIREGEATVGWLLVSQRGFEVVELVWEKRASGKKGFGPQIALPANGLFETDGTSTGAEFAIATHADPAAPERDIALVCLADGTVAEIRATGAEAKTYAARNWARKAPPRPAGAVAADVNSDGVQDLLVLSAEGVWSALAGPNGAERRDLTAAGGGAFAGPVAWARQGEALRAIARDAQGAAAAFTIKFPALKLKGDPAPALDALAQELHWREDRTSLFRPEVAATK